MGKKTDERDVLQFPKRPDYTDPVERARYIISTVNSLMANSPPQTEPGPRVVAIQHMGDQSNMENASVRLFQYDEFNKAYLSIASSPIESCRTEYPDCEVLVFAAFPSLTQKPLDLRAFWQDCVFAAMYCAGDRGYEFGSPSRPRGTLIPDLRGPTEAQLWRLRLMDASPDEIEPLQASMTAATVERQRLDEYMRLRLLSLRLLQPIKNPRWTDDAEALIFADKSALVIGVEDETSHLVIHLREWGATIDPWGIFEAGSRRPPATLKEELLQHYADREPTLFQQCDGFDLEGHRDDCMPVDEDGHCLMFGRVRELMNGATVRVLIPTGVTKKTAATLLRKIAAVLEDSWGESEFVIESEHGPEIPF